MSVLAFTILATLFVIFLISVLYFIKGVKKVEADAIEDLKNNPNRVMDSNVSLSVGSGFKFGFGLGIGFFLAGVLISLVVLIFFGFLLKSLAVNLIS